MPMSHAVDVKPKDMRSEPNQGDVPSTEPLRTTPYRHTGTRTIVAMIHVAVHSSRVLRPVCLLRTCGRRYLALWLCRTRAADSGV